VTHLGASRKSNAGLVVGAADGSDFGVGAEDEAFPEAACRSAVGVAAINEGLVHPARGAPR